MPTWTDKNSRDERKTIAKVVRYLSTEVDLSMFARVVLSVKLVLMSSN
jgi:hypothetical protein